MRIEYKEFKRERGGQSRDTKKMRAKSKGQFFTSSNLVLSLQSDSKDYPTSHRNISSFFEKCIQNSSVLVSSFLFRSFVHVQCKVRQVLVRFS